MMGGVQALEPSSHTATSTSTPQTARNNKLRVPRTCGRGQSMQQGKTEGAGSGPSGLPSFHPKSGGSRHFLHLNSDACRMCCGVVVAQFIHERRKAPRLAFSKAPPLSLHSQNNRAQATMKTTTSSLLLPLLGLLLLVLSPPTHAFTLHSFFGSGSSIATSAPPAPLRAVAGVATTEDAVLSKVRDWRRTGGREGGRHARIP